VPIDPSLRIDKVQLAVSDLHASVDFYERVMGLQLIERDEQHAILGAGGVGMLELLALPDASAAPRRATGLFHVAWLHPNRAGLAETVRRIAAAGWPFEGAADHGVSEALYLADPDGLGIEIYADRPRESWQRPADGPGVSMVTLPLDVEDLLGTFHGEPSERVAAGTGIGHVHLKVSDVDRTAAFYEGLGFEEQARLPSAAFVSAGGYHHHLGLNSWQSAGGSRPPERSPGLRLIEFGLSGPAALEEIAESAGVEGEREDGGALTLHDPDGQALRFSATGA
jgi:catechol 2,3-dioxygenase